MQFGKGAGAIELLGFREIEERENYQIVRPLLNYSKEELQLYLDKREKRYFIDSSNLTYIFHRNRVRHRYTNRFLREFQSGVLKSFEYLDRDREELLEIVDISQICKLHTFKSGSQRSDLYHIDQILKSEGYMLSAKQRDEIVKQQYTVIGGEWVITLGDRIYIAPFKKTKMDKQFKERCRTLKIPSLVRPYLYETDPKLETIKKIMREEG
jgi:tRNA(Ile)-lysidine synthase